MAIEGESARPAASLPAPQESELCGVFVVDAVGNIVASNASARELWSADRRVLVGLPVALLFRGNEISTDPEFLTDEWARLKAEALDQWSMRPARRIGGPPFDARVRIERASGGAGSYIATVLPAQGR
jgi:PAS domain-containing protein